MSTSITVADMRTSSTMKMGSERRKKKLTKNASKCSKHKTIVQLLFLILHNLRKKERKKFKPANEFEFIEFYVAIIGTMYPRVILNRNLDDAF